MAAVIPAAAISPIRTRPTGWSASIRRAVIRSPTYWPTNRSATIKFDTGPVRNTLVTGGGDFARSVSIDSYNGLNSEAVGAGAFASGTVGPGLGAESAEHPDLRHSDGDRQSEYHSGRYQKPVRARNRELPRFRDPDRRAAVRPVQHQRQQERLPDRVGHRPACGITISAPWSSRCRSPASMPPTARRPSRSAPNSTAHRPIMAASIRHRRSIRSSAQSRPKRRKSAPSGSCWIGICWRPPRCSAPMSATPAN